jgi:hypothetical protein
LAIFFLWKIWRLEKKPNETHIFLAILKKKNINTLSQKKTKDDSNCSLSNLICLPRHALNYAIPFAVASSDGSFKLASSIGGSCGIVVVGIHYSFSTRELLYTVHELWFCVL